MWKRGKRTTEIICPCQSLNFIHFVIRRKLIYETYGPWDHFPAAAISRPIPEDVLDVVEEDVGEEDVGEEDVGEEVGVNEFASSGDEDYDYMPLILTGGRRSRVGQLLGSSP